MSPVTLGGDDEISSREAFEKEVMILHRVGSHQHIIGLYGVCMQASKWTFLFNTYDSILA